MTAAPLRALVTGTGPPLVLLHGFAVSPRSYAAAIDLLAAHHTVIAPWLATDVVPWSFDALLDALEATIGDRLAEGVHVVGHSYGGAVAMGFARRHHDRLRSLVLVDALGYSPGLGRMALLGLHPRNARMLSPDLATELFGQLRRQPRAVAAAGWWSYRCHLVDALHTVRDADVPRAVLWGRYDSILPPWLGEEIARELDAPFRAIDLGRRTSGHDWPLRVPDVFATEVRSAISGAASGSRGPR